MNMKRTSRQPKSHPLPSPASVRTALRRAGFSVAAGDVVRGDEAYVSPPDLYRDLAVVWPSLNNATSARSAHFAKQIRGVLAERWPGFPVKVHRVRWKAWTESVVAIEKPKRVR